MTAHISQSIPIARARIRPQDKTRQDETTAIRLPNEDPLVYAKPRESRSSGRWSMAVRKRFGGARMDREVNIKVMQLPLGRKTINHMRMEM
ncbi:hypothetical protein HYALB_00009607 [Hymenoscyphus albidus]|uniref:Uncharacterized protein n=1 Tax=Hymenoscyphus albidus TaxID=595503 RepID=A0A9N9LUB5_9HELO|nr:hypothetical protein HYALB_00009607 [Hymenoscyphus albidus]